MIVAWISEFVNPKCNLLIDRYYVILITMRILKTKCKNGHPITERTKCGHCKVCNKEASKRWRLRNIEKVKAQRRIYNKTHRRDWPEKYAKYDRKKILKKNYGLTEEQYDTLRIAQEVCAICQTNPSPKPLHLDHCHVTGKLRKFLCGSCNRGIGLLKDSSKVLREAAEYLESFNA